MDGVGGNVLARLIWEYYNNLHDSDEASKINLTRMDHILSLLKVTPSMEDLAATLMQKRGMDVHEVVADWKR